MFQFIKIQKLFAFLCVTVLSFGVLFPTASHTAHAAGRKQTFLVSAYYSPLPGQSRYLRGNYEAEIRLNGRGTNGADGTAVYVGMLAAPKSYPFGTKIEVPGLGIGTVHDRGGAIIEGANYHRIDVWMGRGEEGLARALQWGMRTVEGTIYYDTQVSEELSIDDVWANPTNIQKLAPNTQRTMFLGSKGDDVRELQKNLKKLGFFDTTETGEFGQFTKKAVFQFQRRMGIVASEKEWGAGIFGPQTRSALEKALQTEFISPKKQSPSFASLSLGDTGDEVKSLQTHLKKLGFFDEAITGNFGNITQEAVFEFQKSGDIVVEITDYGAGVFGPKTNAALQEKLSQKIETVHAAPSEGQTKKDSPKLVFGNILKKKVFEEILVEAEKFTIGDEGNEIAMMQQELIAKGYLREGLSTGFYGELTREAVIALQQKHQLIVDASADWAGDFGLKTMEALFTEI